MCGSVGCAEREGTEAAAPAGCVELRMTSWRWAGAWLGICLCTCLPTSEGAGLCCWITFKNASLLCWSFLTERQAVSRCGTLRPAACFRVRLQGPGGGRMAREPLWSSSLPRTLWFSRTHRGLGGRQLLWVC